MVTHVKLFVSDRLLAYRYYIGFLRRKLQLKRDHGLLLVMAKRAIPEARNTDAHEVTGAPPIYPKGRGALARSFYSETYKAHGREP